RIEKVDTGIIGTVKNLEGGFLSSSGAKGHGAHTDIRHHIGALTQSIAFDFITLCRY
ncbi:MAG: hypothetical protein ACJAWF_002889, partial [Candidatus Azotimanducaceae bacterium]